MLKSLSLEGVGPAQRLDIDFKPRLNFLTGDNGLGKSFVLDIAWWSLTRTWARGVTATPRPDATLSSIGYSYTGITGDFVWKSQFDHAAQHWAVKQSRPAIPGVVIYAGVDGSFSVWDPARNDWKIDQGEATMPNRPRSFDFRPDDVWGGLLSSDVAGTEQALTEGQKQRMQDIDNKLRASLSDVDALPPESDQATQLLHQAQ